MNKKRKAFWLKQLHQWHWVTSALCLISLLLFSLTGITLNHASQISADPIIREHQGQLPAALLKPLTDQQSGQLPTAVQQWLAQKMDLQNTGDEPEWAADELYLAMPAPEAMPGWPLI